MITPMSSTKSRLAIELMVDAFMQAEIQRDLLLMKSDFFGLFDSFYAAGKAADLPGHTSDMARFARKFPINNN
ncbi:MAG: hypothetical protein D6730_09215 [Bacteroidetes bacterium]|nr:MAG: hypothetical protein D6730_09215 [Bacteroidota bacterium]